jgi:endonuclease YncB( thermonuclease family)
MMHASMRLSRRSALLGLTTAFTLGRASLALAAAATEQRFVVVLLRGALDGMAAVTPYGDPFTVRLACIQAPSLRDGNAGLMAKMVLERLLRPGAWLTLSIRSKAADGVELAEMIAAGSSVPINLSLVQLGMAASCTRLPIDRAA